jgi:chromosome segregation ATPase
VPKDDDSKAADLPSSEQWTNDWYRQQFQRLNWLVTQLNTVLVDELQKATHTATVLRKEVSELSKARGQDSAKIGELNDRIQQHERRLDKASEYLKTLRTKEETK